MVKSIKDPVDCGTINQLLTNYVYIYIYIKMGDPQNRCFSPPDRKGLLDFMLESAFAMLPHHAPQYPVRAVRQWIPPSIPPEQLASGSRRVSR